MTRRYAPTTDAAIEALDVDGIPPSEILRRLRAGEAGLPNPVAMPTRTFYDHLRRTRQRRARDVERIKPGEEEDAADSIRRRALELFRAEVGDLEAQRRQGTELTTQQVHKLERLGKGAEAIKKAMARESTGKAKGKNAGHATQSGPSKLIRHLSKDVAGDDVSQLTTADGHEGSGADTDPHSLDRASERELMPSSSID